MVPQVLPGVAPPNKQIYEKTRLTFEVDQVTLKLVFLSNQCPLHLQVFSFQWVGSGSVFSGFSSSWLQNFHCDRLPAMLLLALIELLL